MRSKHFPVRAGVLTLFVYCGVGAYCFQAASVLAAEHTPKESSNRDDSKDKSSPDPSRGKPDPGAVEVRFTDNSVMKMSLREDKIEYMTPYGKLFIPVPEVRRIEFAMRISDDVAKKIDSAVGTLGSPNYRHRQVASEELFALKEKSYPALMKAMKHADPEIASRAEEIVAKIRAEVPEDQLDTRAFDIIYTDNSRIAGKIESVSLKVGTTQFGELQIKLADVRVMRFIGTGEFEPDNKQIETGPPTLVNYQNNIGKTYIFRVTGSTQGSIWGTDLYTGDSTLAMAAVHAGVLQTGQTGLVKVTIMASPPLFTGSTRNGVTSSNFDRYPAAYRVHR